MSLLKCRTAKHILSSSQGLTLIEMMITTLILTLAATLLATGVPIAADTYHKVVNSANAQVALSTTLTVLRTELGTSADVRVVPEDGNNKIYYLTEEGYWASISNPVENTFRGLVKQYYNVDSDGNFVALPDMVYPLVSDSAITAPLHVRFTVDDLGAADKSITINNISVYDEFNPIPNILASVDSYLIMLRFEE